jgi:hypothetical protein
MPKFIVNGIVAMSVAMAIGEIDGELDPQNLSVQTKTHANELV